MPRRQPSRRASGSSDGRGRARFRLALCVASLCLTALARAETSDDELIASGIRLRRDHRDAEALVEFQRAYAQAPSPRALAQIALAEQALSSWVQAESDLKRALASTTDAWIVAHAALLGQALAAIRTHLATLTVVSSPGAHLILNGVDMGTLPLGALRVSAGVTSVVLRLEPEREAAHSLEVPADAVVVDRVELPEPRPASEAPPVGSPSNDATPPLSEAQAAATIAAASTMESRQRSLAWCALGGAGAVLAASVAAEFAYQSQKAHYNDDQRCAYGELSRDQRCGVYRGRANVARVMATGGYIGAGVLAAASALLFSISFEPSSAPASPEALRAGEPWIALEPGDARFGWRGSW